MSKIDRKGGGPGGAKDRSLGQTHRSLGNYRRYYELNTTFRNEAGSGKINE